MLDLVVTRWLAARGHDVNDAEAGLRRHAAWRAEYTPDGRISEVTVCVLAQPVGADWSGTEPSKSAGDAANCHTGNRCCVERKKEM